MTERPVVFCSHASPDKPVVKAFAERLRADGVDAWVDGWEIDGGDDLVARINDGLARTTAGLAFFSRHTSTSLWVGAEISALTYRAVQGLRVIPVLLDDDAEVPPLLEHYLRRTLCGLGGVGKSTIAGRVMVRLIDRGWVTATIAGPVDLSALCQAVGNALAELPEAVELAERLLKEAPDPLRLAWLRQAVRDHPVLVVLDNFEDNLHLGGDAFRESATEALVSELLGATARGRVLVTSRYPVGPFGPRLHDVRVLPLSRQQARKLLLRLPSLEHLSAEDAVAVLRVTGGHPRLIELVDAAMRGHPSRLTSMADRLDRIATKLGVDLSTARADLDAALTDALDIALRDIALTDLVAGLTPAERDVLLQAAVSNIPVRGTDLSDLIGDETGPAIEVLVRRTLLSPVGPDEYFVERWTAEGLRTIDANEMWQDRCRRAAESRMSRREGGIDVVDAMEAARNLGDAGEPSDAAALASNVCGFLSQRGQLVVVAGFASEILTGAPLTFHPARLLAQHEAEAHEALGLTGAAVRRWRAIAIAIEQLAAAEPDRADYQRGLSVSYERLGDLMESNGQLDEAIRMYQLSLPLATALAENQPDHIQLQRDRLITLNRLAELHRSVGQDEKSAEYRQLAEVQAQAVDALEESVGPAGSPPESARPGGP